MKTQSHRLAQAVPVGTITETYWTPQSKTGGVFSFPGLDVIGNAGNNNYFGPSFFNSDLAITKSFHDSREHRRQVPLRCLQRLQPHQPRQSRTATSSAPDHITGAARRIAPATIAHPVSLNSRFAFSSNREEPQPNLRGASAPLFLCANRRSRRPRSADVAQTLH